jgi:hypothetical protein
MKSKLLMGIIGLGLIGNIPNSQAGLLDWAWNNRKELVAGAVIVAAVYNWMAEDCDQPSLEETLREKALEERAELFTAPAALSSSPACRNNLDQLGNASSTLTASILRTSPVAAKSRFDFEGE